MWLFVLLIIVIQVSRGTGRIVAASIIPHGDFAFDPSLLEEGTREREAADQVARASRQAGEWIAMIDPDLIFLSTPHGIELSTDYGIYLGSHASGHATIGADLANSTKYTVKLPQIDLDPSLSKDLLMKLGSETSGILPFADSEDMPLRWGEVIPLLMIPPSDSSIQQQQQSRRHIIWSHPLRRYTEAPEMVPELVRLGRMLFEWAEAATLDVAIVISSDLSHTHRQDGPYGYSNSSQLFDNVVGTWAMDPCKHSLHLLEKARSLQNEAKSCGFTGLALLHGVLCHEEESTNDFEATVLANRNATYYGMMVATYERQSLGMSHIEVS